MTFETSVTCDWVDRTPAGDVKCGAPWTVQAVGAVLCERHAEVWRTAIAAAQAGSARDALTEECARLTRERDAALAREGKLREALARVATEHQAYPHDDQYTSERDAGYKVGVTDGHRCAAQVARDALVLPADRTALDALLAEARCEAARACVEAARAAAGVAFSRSDDFLPGDNAVLQAVERIAAGAGQEPTP